MQSGNDDILKSMRRKYDVDFYKKTIKLIREYFPNTSIGADVIVGYPGETEEQFMDSYKLLEELGTTHFHVFPYSKRQNTTAAKMDNHIQGGVKKERVKTLINLGEAALAKFSKNLEGSTANVLFERSKDGFFEGYTSHYIKVRVKSSNDLSNQIHKVKLIHFNGQFVEGEL